MPKLPSSLLALLVCSPTALAQVSIAPHNGRGYEIVREALPITHDEAQQLAAIRGAVLGSPKDAASDQFIIQHITSGDFAGIIGPWLGGTQVPGSGEPLGTWLWPDGGAVALPGQTYPGEWGNPTLPMHFQQQPNNACPDKNECRMHYLFQEFPAWNDIPNSGCVEGAPTSWVAEYPIPFVASTSGGGVGDLTLELVQQPQGELLLPEGTFGVIVLISLTPAPSGPGTGALPFGLVQDGLFQATITLPRADFSPLHFPVTANPYESGPVTFPASFLPAGLQLEFRAAAYTSTVDPILLSGVSSLTI